MTTIHTRRRWIVITLLCIAAVAAVVRHRAAPGSTLRDVSTVAMLLWLPVIGSIVGWCYGKLRRRPPAPAALPGFAPGSAFEPHVLVQLTLRPASIPAEDAPLAAGEHHGVLVVGHQGFQARWQAAPGETVRRGAPHRVPVQFLAPQLACARLPDGTAFRLLVGEAFIGDGQVLQTLFEATPA